MSLNFEKILFLPCKNSPSAKPWPEFPGRTHLTAFRRDVPPRVRYQAGGMLFASLAALPLPRPLTCRLRYHRCF